MLNDSVYVLLNDDEVHDDSQQPRAGSEELAGSASEARVESASEARAESASEARAGSASEARADCTSNQDPEQKTVSKANSGSKVNPEMKTFDKSSKPPPAQGYDGRRARQSCCLLCLVETGELEADVPIVKMKCCGFRCRLCHDCMSQWIERGSACPVCRSTHRNRGVATRSMSPLTPRLISTDTPTRPSCGSFYFVVCFMCMAVFIYWIMCYSFPPPASTGANRTE